MFDPFFTTKGVGRGLGLASVSGIVRAHRGGIGIESELGQGAVVTVVFPAAAQQDPAARPDAPPESMELGGGLVLVADDETGVRQLIREVLEQAGFEVAEARDGAEALARMRALAGEVRLVILDATMPNLTGPQVLQQTKDLDLNVILTSGYGSEIGQGVEGRITAFLPKPFTPAELLRCVSDALNESGTPNVS